MWASSSTLLFPEWDQSSLHYRQKTPWFFTGLRPYFVVCVVTTVLLSSFYLVLIFLWSTHVFDRSLFDINRLGQFGQISSVLTQAWAVGTIAVITFTVQAIASDLAIRRRSSNFLHMRIRVSWFI